MYRGRRFLSKEGKAAKESIGWEIKKQYRSKPLKCPIGVDIDFYVPNSRSDLDNLLKGVLDCMSGLVYEDDRQIIQILTNKWIDKKEPRIEIIVNQL